MILKRVEQGPPGSPPHRLDYQADGDRLTVTHTIQRRDPETGALIDGPQTIDTFDFTGTPDGRLDVDSIETTLPVQPILAAERVGGELTVTVLDWEAR